MYICIACISWVFNACIWLRTAICIYIYIIYLKVTSNSSMNANGMIMNISRRLWCTVITVHASPGTQWSSTSWTYVKQPTTSAPSGSHKGQDSLGHPVRRHTLWLPRFCIHWWNTMPTESQITGLPEPEYPHWGRDYYLAQIHPRLHQMWNGQMAAVVA